MNKPTSEKQERNADAKTVIDCLDELGRDVISEALSQKCRGSFT